MATITAAAGGGNWNTGATWVGGVAPTAADDALLTLTSGNVTIDGAAGTESKCRSLTCTGYTGTLTHGAAKILEIGDGTAGALVIVAGMTYAPNVTSLIKFKSTTTGNNITTGGKAMGLLTFDGVGGAWTLQDALIGQNLTGNVTLTNGSLTTNNQTITLCPFSSSNANTRSLTLGTSSWGLGTSGIWDITDPTGMTLSAASSTITFTNTSVAGTFNGGGLTYGTLSCTTLTTGAITITGANTFGTLTLSMGATTKSVTSGYAIGANQTVSGTFTAAGNSAILRNFIYSGTAGTARTITAATVTVTHTDFRDITGAGAGSWNFSGLTTTANGDAGGNSGITFTTPKSCYMKTASSQNWSASVWFTTSGGSTAIVPAMPLVHDLAIFDANSITAGSVVITNNQARLPDMTWTGVLNTPTFASGSTAWEAYGDIILVAGMARSGTGNCSLRGRGSFLLDGGGLTWPSSSGIIVNCSTGTYSLASNFASASTLNVTSGTFTGAYTATFTTVTTDGGTYTPQGTVTCTTNTLSSGVINLSVQFNGSGAISVTGGTINDTGASGELKGTTGSFTGGTLTLRKVTLSSTMTINTGATIVFPAGASVTRSGAFTFGGSGAINVTYGGLPTFTTTEMTVAAASGGVGSIFNSPVVRAAI